MTDVSRIKARTTTGAVLHAHGLPGAKRGPCPIHGGDNRSAFVHDGQRWTCWTQCGTGDVVRLVELLRGVGFRDAVRWLENFTGLRADEPETVPNDEDASQCACGGFCGANGGGPRGGYQPGDIGAPARRAWLASIEERWNNLRRFDPWSPYMDDLEDEWREARRMPGAEDWIGLMNEIATILWEERKR